MPMPEISFDRRTKILIAVGCVLLIVGLGYRFQPHIRDAWNPDQEIAVKEKQLHKYRQMAKSAELLTERFKANEKVLNKLQSGLLSGTTPALAAVDIQNILNSIAVKRGVEIRKVRVLKPEELESAEYISIPVQFTLSSTIRQLKGILYGIETASRYLTVKKITIKVPRAARAKPQAMIQADVTVAGMMKWVQPPV
jgi:Tfp pilus assembly protein PilO